jgi:hypothetical protein
MDNAVVRIEPEIPSTLMEILRWNPDYHRRKKAILMNFRKSTEHYLICGKLLCDAERSRDWRMDGSCAKNFYQWVEHELGFKRSNAQRMMLIWTSFRELIPSQADLILQIDFSKLAMIAPILNKLDSEHQLEVLHSAKETSVRALEDTITEIKGGTPTDACMHQDKYELYRKCLTCGKFIKEG